MSDRTEALLRKVESGCIDAQEYTAVFPNDGYHVSNFILGAAERLRG